MGPSHNDNPSRYSTIEGAYQEPAQSRATTTMTTNQGNHQRTASHALLPTISEDQEQTTSQQQQRTTSFPEGREQENQL